MQEHGVSQSMTRSFTELFLFNKSAYAVSERLYVEVDKQTDFAATEFQVSKHLRFVNIVKRFNGFNFNDNVVLHHEIHSITHFQLDFFVDQR